VGVKIATKLRWFDRGAAALVQVFPDALAPLGPDPAPHYVCPQCAEPDASGQRYRVQLFPRSAIESGELTAEHVPPKSFGGRELILTCKRCNDAGGFLLEADARKRENPVDVMLGVAKKPSHVRLTAGDHTVSVALMMEEGMLTTAFPPRRKQANDPRKEKAFWEALPRLVAERSTFSFNFSKDLHLPRRANVAWLRHAYLAMFAVAGYRYIFQPGLGIVRKQIKEPDAEYIPVFLAALPGEHSWAERRIGFIGEPESLQSWAVQFGRYVVFLPTAGDTEFYARMAEDAQARQQARLTGEAIAWPTEPLFGLAAV
jgi:hypothetical protein